MSERIYSVEDGEAIVNLPDNYSALSVQDLIDHLTMDMNIRKRYEKKLESDSLKEASELGMKSIKEEKNLASRLISASEEDDNES